MTAGIWFWILYVISMAEGHTSAARISTRAGASASCC